MGADRTDYAVIDFETTGLRPSRGHRVVEVGIVQLDADLRTTAEWSSLVRPDRSIQGTEIHGIDQHHLLNAPTFDDLVGDVLHELDGRVLVAHNARFEMRFLEAELRRCGVRGTGGCVCTSDLAVHHGLPAGLRAACRSRGITMGPSHHALSDAHTTAELLRRLAPDGPPSARPWRVSTGSRLPSGEGGRRTLTRAGDGGHGRPPLRPDPGTTLPAGGPGPPRR